MRRILPLAAAVALTALLPADGWAATIPVNDEADAYGTGPGCGLREALWAARHDLPFGGCPIGSGPDTIRLPAGRYVLTLGPAGDDLGDHGDLDVAGDTTIEGAGAGSTTIDGVGLDRVLDVQIGARVELRGVTITGGHAPDGVNGPAASPGTDGTQSAANGGRSGGGHGGDGGSGGGIRSNANTTLIVEDAVISANRAGVGGDGGAGGAGGHGHRGGSSVGVGGNSVGGNGGNGGTGGGIHSMGTLQVVRSRVTGNRSGHGGAGGDGGQAGQGSTPSCETCSGGDGGASLAGIGGVGGDAGGISARFNTDIVDSVVADNEGGNGGNGGAGGTGGRGGNYATLANPPSPATFGHNGGKGGDSVGGNGGISVAVGGIHASWITTIRNTRVIDNRGGASGHGGDAGSAGDGGNGNDSQGGDGGAGGESNGGRGGHNVAVGGVSLTAPTSEPHSITGATAAHNTAGRGGDGGDGASAGDGGFGVPAGRAGATAGGPGGSALTASGGLYLPGNGFVGNTTIAANVGGQGGDGGNGGSTASAAPGAPESQNEGGDGGDAGGAGGVLPAGVLVQVTVSGNEHRRSGAGGDAGSGGDRSNGADGSAGQAGGLWGVARLGNTVVADNEAPNCDLVPAIDDGNNVSYPDTSCPGENADPRLGPLRDNGGPTETMSLGAGSPAIDRVPATNARCLSTDQRGVARPQGAACDTGAYELQAPAALTGEALDVGANGARITGVATPNSGDGSYRFEFGQTPAYGSSTDPRPVGPGPAQASEAIGGLSPGTSYHYRLVVTTDGGTSAGENRTFTTTQAPFPPVVPGGEIPVDRQLPAFTSKPRVSPGSFEANPRRGPSLVTRAAVGARIRFGLSEPARVTFRVLKPAAGRLRRGRCEKPARRNRGGRRCTRYVALRGSFAHQAVAGLNQPRFSGRLRNRALKAGRYRLTATATDAAGNNSAPANANFKIKRPRSSTNGR